MYIFFVIKNNQCSLLLQPLIVWTHVRDAEYLQRYLFSSFTTLCSCIFHCFQGRLKKCLALKWIIFIWEFQYSQTFTKLLQFSERTDMFSTLSPQQVLWPMLLSFQHLPTCSFLTVVQPSHCHGSVATWTRPSRVTARAPEACVWDWEPTHR